MYPLAHAPLSALELTDLQERLRPENVSRDTENVQVMKDYSMTVKEEDLHARNKAIHFNR